MDLVAGLHWLRENLPAFNGNPNMVTLMGHGHGAALANILIVSPVASGSYLLFLHDICSATRNISHSLLLLCKCSPLREKQRKRKFVYNFSHTLMHMSKNKGSQTKQRERWARFICLLVMLWEIFLLFLHGEERLSTLHVENEFIKCKFGRQCCVCYAMLTDENLSQNSELVNNVETSRGHLIAFFKLFCCFPPTF